MFNLHPTLAADTFKIGQFSLCIACLMNNSQLPWVILVPQRAGMRELYELSSSDQQQAFAESLLVGKTLMAEFNGDKLNAATIGNMVPQLHIHHIVRFKHDSAWPKPVWGNISEKKYTQISRQQMLKRLRTVFSSASKEFSAND